MQVTFNIKIQIHISNKKSPYALLFKWNPRLSLNSNKLQSLKYTNNAL